MQEATKSFANGSESKNVIFRPMRRKKQALSEEESRELLRTEKRAALAVQGEYGYPYVVPIDFYYEPSEQSIYFHSSREGHKIESLCRSNKVCCSVWDAGSTKDGDWALYVKSVVVFGRAEFVLDEDLREEKIRRLARKYYPSEEEVEREIARDLHRAQVVRIVIEHMSGKRVHEK